MSQVVQNFLARVYCQVTCRTAFAIAVLILFFGTVAAGAEYGGADNNVDAAATEAIDTPAPNPSTVQPPSIWRQDHMLLWGEDRSKLAQNGFTYDFFYIIDSLGDFDTPAQTRQEYNGWGRIRGTVNADFGRMGGPKGLTFFATGLWQYGQNMGAILGSIANPSGLVSIHTFRLDSLWLHQALWDGKLQIRAGQFALQDYYGNQVYGGNFLIEPLDYNFENMGNVRASWDPASSPAAAIRIQPTRSFFFHSGIFAPRNYSGTGFNYRKTDNNGFDTSAAWASEFGYNTFAHPDSRHANYQGILKVGSIYNGGKFTSYPTNTTVRGNYMIYAQLAQPLYRVSASGDRGLDFTAGLATGPSDKAEVPTEETFGATWNGPWSMRSHDAFSIGVVNSNISSKYNDYLAAGSMAALVHETALEINYKAQLTPWMYLQPVFQHYSNLGGAPGKSASIAGMRLFVDF